MPTERETSAEPRQAELDELRALKRRAEDLTSTHLEALDLFHLPGGAGRLAELRRTPGRVAGFANFVPEDDARADGSARHSLASTARCARSLLVCRDVKQGYADYTPMVDAVLRRYDDGDLGTYGLDHLNAFTVGQVLPALRQVLDGDTPDGVKHLVDDAAETLRRETAREGVSLPVAGADGHRRFPPHGYLTYWALVSLSDWDQLDQEAARPSLQWSETELYRQIALFSASDDERSDAYQLGYNLLAQHRFNRFGVGDRLIDVGLRTLFGAQLERGVWEKRAPLFRYGDRGEAYCFSFEFLSALLRELRNSWEFLLPYESHLEAALTWAERNAALGYGPPVWRSGHSVDEDKPESWATAEVYAFLQLYAAYLSWRIETIVLEGFRGRPARTPDPGAFDDLSQPDVELPGQEGAVALADLLKERLLEPLRSRSDPPKYSLAHHPRPDEQVRSGILFGPPGTGKTTYIKRVAEYLGWPLVVLDPSDFAREGLHLVAPVASTVFAKLFELEDTVIFFDEMESLMHNRGEGDASFEQDFLTTSFIPKLQELADRATSLFFVATNHYSTIDPAAKRPGRFDFRLQILPPSYGEKLRMAEKELGDDFAKVATELRRGSHRRSIALASRSEMRRLLSELQRQPERAEDVLSEFHPELADDDRLEEEARHNSIEGRA